MEALNAETIRRHCQIFELEVHDQLDSTQIRARQRIADGLLRPAVVIAESQRAGRGQQGRSWVSPPGAAIYLTTLWPTTRPPSQLGGLSLAVGLAIRRMLAHWQIDAQLKWPNDIWVDQRKLAGVLIEIVSSAVGSRLLIGIGLNLQLPESATAEIDQPWTELSHWLHPLPSRNQLIGRLLHELQQVLEIFELTGFAAFSEEWQRADALRGRQVWLRSGSSAEQGQALGIDELGRLKVDVDGVIRPLSAGEVSIRPLQTQDPLMSRTKKLLLDLGNSRLKWAIDDGSNLHVGEAVAHSETGLGDLSAMLSAASGVASAWMSSTALSLSPALIELVASRLGCETRVFVSPKEALGIRSAYDEPATLGSDRFLALVGARTQVAGAFLVADAGTALTLDMVDDGGQHLGGLIVPSPVLMRDALHRGTAGIRTGERVRVREFARNTDDAVWSGACLACTALIGHAYRHGAMGVGADVQLLLAGGSMPALEIHLSIPHRSMPNLVLEGLLQWARSEAV